MFDAIFYAKFYALFPTLHVHVFLLVSPLLVLFPFVSFLLLYLSFMLHCFFLFFAFTFTFTVTAASLAVEPCSASGPHEAFFTPLGSHFCV